MKSKSHVLFTRLYWRLSHHVLLNRTRNWALHGAPGPLSRVGPTVRALRPRGRKFGVFRISKPRRRSRDL